jgi:hypothetical protein
MIIKKAEFKKTIPFSILKSFFITASRSKEPMPGIVKIISMIIVEKKATLKILTKLEIKETKEALRQI